MNNNTVTPPRAIAAMAIVRLGALGSEARGATREHVPKTIEATPDRRPIRGKNATVNRLITPSVNPVRTNHLGAEVRESCVEVMYHPRYRLFRETVIESL